MQVPDGSPGSAIVALIGNGAGKLIVPRFRFGQLKMFTEPSRQNGQTPSVPTRSTEPPPEVMMTLPLMSATRAAPQTVGDGSTVSRACAVTGISMPISWTVTLTPPRRCRG